MEETGFIKDSTNSNDEEKLIYHFYNDEMRKFQRRFSLFIMLTSLFFIMTITGIYLIANIPNHIETGTIVAIAGGMGFFVSIILLFTNKIEIKINKFDLVYLPISQMNFQNGSILVDRSGIIDATGFYFTNLDQNDIRLVESSYKELTKQINEMPYVLTDGKTLEFENDNEEYHKENIKMNSEEVNFIDLNNKLRDTFKRSRPYHVDLKAYKYNSGFLKALNSLTVSSPQKTIEESKEFDILKGLNQINGIIDDYQKDKKDVITDIDDLSLDILKLLEKSIPRMDFAVHSSLYQVALPITYKFTDVIEKASYNYYCPNCNAELIERLEEFDYSHDGTEDKRVFFPVNTKMKLVDLESNTWRCPLCEKETDQPFPKHKLEDELFTPVYDKLYEENYLERLKVYNHINDEKRKYASKAEELYHQVMRESRAKVDNIKSKIRTIQSELTADEMSVRDLNQLLLKYKKIAEDKAKQIENDLIVHKKAIEAENRKSREKIHNAVDNAKKQIDQSTKKYSKLEREDQAKRDSVQRQIASNTRATAKNTAKIAKYTKSIDQSTQDTNRILQGQKPNRKY